MQMACETRSLPSPDEVRRQLDHMLAGALFQSNENPSKFLKFVTERALASEPITQSIIGCELFPGKYLRGNIPDVRVTASNLRDVIARYYANDGERDLVIIALPSPPLDKKLKLPAGKAYKPLFSYNPKSPANKEFERGVVHINQLSPVGLFYALHYFKQTLKLEPGHAAAYAGIAEAYYINSLYGCPEPAMPYYLLRAQEAAVEAVRLNPDLWQGHAALGAVHTCLWEWDQAAISFGAALERNELETRDYSAYAFYLLAVGRRDEALHLVKDKAERKEGDPGAERIYPLFLYATRQFKEAERLLRNLHDKYETDWIVMLTLVLVFFALERYELVLKINNRLVNVMSHMTQAPEIGIWPGLTGLAYARLGGAHEKPAREKLAQLEEYHEKTGDREPTQLALMYMGLGEPERAIAHLARGCDDYFPFMIWLHIWPIFDPLRDHPKFQELVRRMELPARK